MHRRDFLRWSAAAPAALTGAVKEEPEYRIVSAYSPAPRTNFPGKVISVHAEKSIDPSTEEPDFAVVRDMVSRGMKALTQAGSDADAWRRFFTPDDFVGIKVNCSGAPKIMSNPAVVSAIVGNLVLVGVRPERIMVYERFEGQLKSANYGKYIAHPVKVRAIEVPRGSILPYDAATYVEVNFFGEEDTRSNLVREVVETFTKIINVPNMKEHQAAGVTGCLKNIAYGNFSNVARSHAFEKTHTKTFIGTLASVEPLRSKTVLNIMDGLKGVWHAGPFSESASYRFFPKTLLFGTDPVSMDRILLERIEAKRKAEGAVSLWDRGREHLTKNRPESANQNRFIREPGHIEYAASLGLGIYDRSRIRLEEIEL